MSYYNSATGDETLVLAHGRINPDEPTLVRMHAFSMFTDALNEAIPRSRVLKRSMEIIAEKGAGIIMLLSRKGPDRLKRNLDAHRNGTGIADMDELREYGVGAQILAEIGIRDMILLTNSHHTLVALEGYGLSIVGEMPIDIAEAD